MPSPGTWLTFQPRQRMSALCGSGAGHFIHCDVSSVGVGERGKGLSLGLVGRIWVRRSCADHWMAPRSCLQLFVRNGPSPALAKVGSERVEDTALGGIFCKTPIASDYLTEFRNVLNTLKIYWGMV